MISRDEIARNNLWGKMSKVQEKRTLPQFLWLTIILRYRIFRLPELTMRLFYEIIGEL